MLLTSSTTVICMTSMQLSNGTSKPYEGIIETWHPAMAKHASNSHCFQQPLLR